MSEEDVLEAIDDVSDKLVELKTKVDNIFKRDMSLVFKCTECRGVRCSNCDDTGLLPRVSS